MKVLASVVLTFFAIASCNALQAINGKVKITTITTSGCGDTVNFITAQLADAYEEYKDFLELEFVPWGRTRRNTDGSLTCQFGASDCFANQLQRCALDLLKDNQDAQMSYMNCEFTSPYPSYLQNSFACAVRAGLSPADVDYCVATSKGDDLSVVAEAAAQQPMAEINFVPAIVFNDVISVTDHTLARTRLKSMICFALAQDTSTGVTNCSF